MTDRDQARSGGVMKNTRARRAILNALAESHEHPDAETVYALAKQSEPRLSLATVYRNLRVRSAIGWHRRALRYTA